MNAFELTAVLQLNNTQFMTSLRQSIENSSKLTKTLMAASGAAIAFIKNGIEYAHEIENATAKVNSIAKVTEGNMLSSADIQKQLVAVSNETGVAVSELGDSMYNYISAVGETAGAMDVVETSARLAVAGFTSSDAALSTLTAAMNAYHLEASEADKVANSFIKTQNLGVITVDQLSQIMGTVMATASGYGVSLGQVEGALIGATKAGIPAAQAGTYLRGMFSELGSEGTTVAGILQEKTGKSFSQLMKDGVGLGEVMTILQESAQETGTDFINLWSNTRAGTVANAMLSQGFENVDKWAKEVWNDTDVLNDAYEEMQTGTWKLNKFQNMLKNTMGVLGGTVADLLMPVFEKVSKIIEKFSKWVANLSDRQKKLIGTILLVVAALGPAILVFKGVTALVKSLKTSIMGIGGNGGLVGAFKYLAANPIVAVIAGLAAVAVAITGVILKATKLRREYKKAAKSRKEAIEQVQVEGETTKLMADRLVELSEKENKSAEDKAELKQLTKELNEKVGDLNLTYDEEKDKLNLSRDAIYNKINAYKDQLVVQAYAEQAEQLIAEKVKDQIELDKLRTERAELEAQKRNAINDDELVSIQSRIDGIDAKERQLLANQTDREAEFETISRRASGELGTLSSDFQAMADEVEAQGDRIPQDLKDAIDSGKIAVPQSVAELKALMNPQFRAMVEYASASGKAIPADLAKRVREGKVDAGTAAKELYTYFKDNAKGDQRELNALGTFWSKGLADGTTSPEALARFRTSAKKSFETFLNESKKVSRTESPSKVMRDEVGIFWGLGIAEGIKKSIPQVEKTATTLMDDVMGILTGENYEFAGVGAAWDMPSISMSGDGYGYDNGGGDVTQNVYITAPQELNPSEVARRTKNATRDLVLSLRGVR